MAGAFDPFVTPIDYILLGGKKSPGIATLSGASDKRKWDVQVGYGLSGGITIYRGREIAQFTCTIKLSTPQDWIDWASWKSIVARPPNGTRPKTLTIWHPWLESLDISAVGVEEVGQPEETDETGVYSIPIKFIEFRQPKLALAKPEAASTPEDNDPINKVIEGLTSQLQVEKALGDKL